MTAAKIDQSAMTPEQLALISAGFGMADNSIYYDGDQLLWPGDKAIGEEVISIPELSTACKKMLREAKWRVFIEIYIDAGCVVHLVNAIGTGESFTIRKDGNDDLAILHAFADWQKGRAG